MRFANLCLFVVLVSLFFSSCSTMKLSDSYKSDGFETIRNQKILIVSRTPLDDVRKDYELAIAKQLQSKGMNAVASHVAFPSLERIDNKTAERIAEVVSMFRAEGFDIVLLTSLKDVQEQEILRRAGGYNSLPQYYSNKYITLRGYYDDVHAPPKLPPREQDPVTYVEKSTTFVLEAVTYNLALEEEKRLLSVTTAEVTDPDSGKGVRTAFAKLIAEELR